MGYKIAQIDTPRSKETGILVSTRPLKLDSLRYLAQRWDSPQALTFGLLDRSCMTASQVFSLFSYKYRGDFPWKVSTFPKKVHLHQEMV